MNICYFIATVNENEDVSEIVHKVKKFKAEVNKRSINAKSRARVKEWLHKDGFGFEHLRSGKQEREEMLQLGESVRYSSWQEARQYGEFPCISWKGLSIFTTDHNFGEDNKVDFTVGFNFRGPRVVHFTPVSKQSDDATLSRENSKPQYYPTQSPPSTQISSHTHSNKLRSLTNI